MKNNETIYQPLAHHTITEPLVESALEATRTQAFSAPPPLDDSVRQA